jgi:hypothetical protein
MEEETDKEPNWFDFDEEEEIEIESEPESYKKCKWCESEYLEDEIDSHEKYCNKNPANKKGKCQYCKKSYLLRDNRLENHEKGCTKNPDNIKPEPVPIDLSNFEYKMDKVLKHAKIGIIHELNRENVIEYFKIKPKSKVYEAKLFFYPEPAWKIANIIKELHEEKILIQDSKNKWFSLNPKSK